MLRHRASLISLETIDPGIAPYHDDWEYEVPQLEDSEDPAEPDSSLCSRCQNFDIQSFAKNKRKGYLLKDVEVAAADGCHFCGLLLDAVKDTEKPEYFYSNAFMGRTTLNPDLYIHMTISESYKNDELRSPSHGLRANRLLVELGDRFSGMRNPSSHEICITADPRMYALFYYSIMNFAVRG